MLRAQRKSPESIPSLKNYLILFMISSFTVEKVEDETLCSASEKFTRYLLAIHFM